ncbi:hypothetical protein PHYSODRAFT_486186 [Phytophthora sojae]|uniref:Uncharacterized protein n=1 Tax=Phytophthora sojae (strain P6497) TaxID=1094619 RepID=G4YVG0_PHYSP|nr:hypothetical protein PHYSODRAFT_486186 [Phytophthora sojae]EGZ25523.1 hypothetical protein PHYSODRAFT_486186 [Phytophthora sojae]|eukprot:XP_009520811.1 hypothetical protein PHYSODRAFT_486186 [Phytophthora sojae]
MNRALTERVTQLESQRDVGQGDSSTSLPAPVVAPQSHCEDSATVSKSCGSKALPKGPAAIWFDWYAKTPRMWDVCADRQKKSAYKHTVNYMKLFLPNGFALDPSAPDYTDQVVRTGIEAEAGMYRFFEEHGVKSKRGSAVLKQLRKFFRESKLNSLVDAYRAPVAVAGVTDPAPKETQELFTRK